MIKMICDKCGNSAGSIGYDILVRLLHNPTPISIMDTSDPAITHDSTHMRMVLCQKCYREFKFPNIYKTWRTKELEWDREEGDDMS